MSTFVRRSGAVLGAVGLVLAATAVLAQGGLYIYPQKGQTKEQQGKDGYECQQWAVEQSGVNPQAPAAGPDRGDRARGAVGGAARGAALGAGVGAIAGDAGKGAAAGAAVGGVGGRRGAIRQELHAATAERSSYDRAFAACMEARGYTVK